VAKKKLPLRLYGSALWFVARRSFTIAPGLAALQLVDSLIGAALPIATTYFAALTTTALTAAYNGEVGAADQALLYVAATALLGIISLAWYSIGVFLSTRGRYKIDVAIESAMIHQFTALPFHQYDNKEMVDMHEKAQRFSRVFSSIFTSLGSMLTSIVGAIGAIIALTSVSPVLAAIVFISVLPSVVINIKLARSQTEHWETNITNRRRMWEIEWTLRRPEVMAEMRVYGVIRTLIGLYLRYREADEKKRMEIDLRSGWRQLGANILESVVELGALIWVVLQIIAHTQPVGQFLFVQQMVGRAMGSVRALGSRLGTIDEEFAHMIDYQKFMEIETLHDAGEDLKRLPESISFDKVSFHYPHAKTRVLHDISFEITRGSKIAFVGENGAGKSTLIKLLLGLYAPTEGEVRLGSQKLQDFSITSWHRFIGLLWQQYVNYNYGTIRENIELGDVSKKATASNIASAMKQAEFQSVVDKLERGTDTYIDKWMGKDNDEASATELSGGQYQRLALARNFFRDAPIIILDEPTSAIDALAETRIFNRILSEKEKTIITISHRFSTIQKMDVIYMLKDGRIVESGTAKELTQKKGEFYRMFESQI
jgi:ATP-binding cassette subfamily B protein/ATP-binding cassette subfamily C protein